MAIQKISIQQLLEWQGRIPILDVRSPGEYEHAHIPGAYSLPLFTDEERKVVGTAYKQQSRQTAIKIGLAYFGVKMVDMVETVERILPEHATKSAQQSPTGKEVIVHCWRGGMRSAGVSWLLDLYGFTVYTLVGGYKSFRRWCNQQFAEDHSFRVVGGFTGSGKTSILHTLAANDQQILDLEGVASHKGSVFGHLGESPQPSQEMFENYLALALGRIVPGVPLWVEDESQHIGKLNIPFPLFRQLRSKSLYFLDIPFEQRLPNIISTYGQFDKAALEEGILRLRKRMGGLETKMALQYLQENNIADCFRILLKYYDRYYLKGLSQDSERATTVTKLVSSTTDPNINAQLLIRQTVNKPVQKSSIS